MLTLACGALAVQVAQPGAAIRVVVTDSDPAGQSLTGFRHEDPAHPALVLLREQEDLDGIVPSRARLAPLIPG